MIYGFYCCFLLFFFSYSDYRLNPVLRKACKADIPKFCQNVLNKATDDSELEGQVISCLKLKYADQVLNYKRYITLRVWLKCKKFYFCNAKFAYFYIYI